jgi:cytochrome P450
LTLKVVARSLFGSNIDSEIDDFIGALNVLLETFNQLSPLALAIGHVADPDTIAAQDAAVASANRIVTELIAKRRSAEPTNDLLSILINAVDHEGTLTDSEIRDEVMTLLMAGHETTANALSWQYHLLLDRPDIAARIAEEVAALGGAPIGFEHLESLAFTRRVFNESLRIYPPAWVISRSAAQHTWIGTAEVEPGTTVFVSPWLSHRDPRWFVEPLTFDPDRWLSDAAPRYAFFPFGGGKRNCIGENFAWAEGVIVTAVLARSVAFHRIAEPAVTRQHRITLRPEHGVPVRVERLL